MPERHCGYRRVVRELRKRSEAKPMLCADTVVRNILSGAQTQDRRPADKAVAKGYVRGLSERLDIEPGAEWLRREDGDGFWHDAKGPHGVPGDRIYVRECWRLEDFANHGGDTFDASVRFRSDNGIGRRVFGLTPDEKLGWRPSIHMPKWAARTWLRVKRVWVERVQDISEEDAWAEGCRPGTDLAADAPRFATARDAFATLWDDLYGAGSWAANGYVFCCEFEREVSGG